MALSEEELKAQQQFYQRTGGPVIGQRSTLRTQPNKLFKESQQTGRIPSNFKNWAEAERAFLAEVDKGVKPDKARKALGLTYQNVIGNYYFDIVTDRNTGERRGFNPRAVNEDLPPIAERDLRVVQGDAAVDNFRAQLKDGWGDYKKKAAYDPMAISSRDEATQVRNYLTSFLGRGDPRDQAMQIQRGHGFSASQSGGSTDLMDLWAELGHYNVHGHAGLAGNPRMHPDTMYDMNAAPTAEAAYYNQDLDRRGLTINPRSTQWPGAIMAIDESNTQTFGRRSGQSYSMGPAIDKTPGVSEAALPAQQRRRDELMAQMGASGPRQAINQANSMSIIMDPTQSIGTPVRVIQQGVPKTPMPKDVKATVVSPSGFERTIKTTQSTREELTAKLLNAGVDPGRVEQIVNRTRPFAKGPTVVPAPTAPTIKLTPSQSLGQKASAVFNIDPELVSQFSRQIGNRINRRLGKSPFDATLDTTSQKYLENIGKYQQFIDLDEASKAALGLYGENVKQYYADLNRQLRTGSSANLTPQQIAVNEFLQSNLNRTLDALPSEQKDLYRAIKDPVREGLVDLKVGDIYTDKGFGSFSADEKAALRFIRKDAPSALITVRSAEGKNIGPVMEFDEAEFLQKPGAQYRLESVDEIFSPKVGGTVPNYKFTQVTSQSLGQKAAAIANREPVPQPKPVVVAPKPVVKPKPVTKPSVKPAAKPKAAAKPAKPVRVMPSRVKPKAQESPRNQGSASMQIRRMQNIQPDVIQLPMFTSFPSIEL